MKIKLLFSDRRISVRMVVAFIIFFALFFVATIVSYVLLPDGALIAKNSLSNINLSNDIVTSAVQIFSWNFLGLLVMALASLFAFANRNGSYLSYGYVGLGVQFLLNAITLGTWSFTATAMAAPALGARLLRAVDILHRAGPWEMAGQLLIVCALSRISIIRTCGKDIERRPFKSIRLTKAEISGIVMGLLFMAGAALIEGHSIIAQTGR